MSDRTVTEKYILPALLAVTGYLALTRPSAISPQAVTTAFGPQQQQKKKRKFSLVDLPAPCLVTVSAFLSLPELLILERLLSFDSDLVGQCWKEALRAHVTQEAKDDESDDQLLSLKFGTLPYSAPMGARQLLTLLHQLEGFEAKTFLLGGLAGHFELAPPFHFFRKERVQVANCHVIPFHSVVAAGRGDPVDWLSLSFVFSEKNAEIFICTGNDSPESRRTLVITAPLVSKSGLTIEGSIAVNLQRTVEQMRLMKIRPIVEVLVERSSTVTSALNPREFEKFNKRFESKVSLLALIDAGRVNVETRGDPVSGHCGIHKLILRDLEQKINDATAKISKPSRSSFK